MRFIKSRNKISIFTTDLVHVKEILYTRQLNVNRVQTIYSLLPMTNYVH